MFVWMMRVCVCVLVSVCVDVCVCVTVFMLCGGGEGLTDSFGDSVLGREGAHNVEESSSWWSARGMR